MKDDLPADLPIRRERIEILARETAGLRHAEDVDLDLLAAVTCGFSAAELTKLCRYARDATAGSEAGSISMADFSDAVDACLRDGSRPLFLEPYPRLIAAYEVAGQALVASQMWGVQPARRITILPDQPGDPFEALPHDVSEPQRFLRVRSIWRWRARRPGSSPGWTSRPPMRRSSRWNWPGSIWRPRARTRRPSRSRRARW